SPGATAEAVTGLLEGTSEAGTSAVSDKLLELCVLFFYTDAATTEIYPLSLHDALPICRRRCPCTRSPTESWTPVRDCPAPRCLRSEEHTSELQSRSDLVCRLLLEKKNT